MCDLVSNGVGGWTVEEAKERITYAEVVQLWIPYMHKHGSLNVGMRLEQGFALLAVLINHALGGKAKVKDYMPHADQNATIDDVMNILLSGKDR